MEIHNLNRLERHSPPDAHISNRFLLLPILQFSDKDVMKKSASLTSLLLRQNIKCNSKWFAF